MMHLAAHTDHIGSQPGQYGVRIRYSTLSEYFESVAANTKVTYATLTGDFFPYADNPDSFWTVWRRSLRF